MTLALREAVWFFAEGVVVFFIAYYAAKIVTYYKNRKKP